MGKWLASLLLLFMFFSVLSGILAGGDGMTIHVLDGDISETDTTITLDSTSGFLESGKVYIDNEKISYTGATSTQLTGATRGVDGTAAAAHADGTYTYTVDANAITSALGFDIAQTAEKSSVFSVVVIPLSLMTITLPQIMMWNFQFLQGEFVWLALPFFAVTAALIVVIALMMINVAQGMFSS